MNFFLGRVTRDHAEIDWFSCLLKRLPSSARWEDAATTPSQASADQQVDSAKEGEELSYSWLAVDTLARW